MANSRSFDDVVQTRLRVLTWNIRWRFGPWEEREPAILATQRELDADIVAGDSVFTPRMKALLSRAVALARRRTSLAETTRRQDRRRLDRDLDAIMVLAPTNRHGKRLRKRYAKVRSHLFTVLEHPEVAPDNKCSERELRPMATYRKVTGGFRSDWDADLFAAVKSVIATARRQNRGPYQAINHTLGGTPFGAPG